MSSTLDKLQFTQLQDNFYRAVPEQEATIKTVTLPDTPDTPFDVEHGLTSGDSKGVRYVLLNSSEPVILYSKATDVSGPSFIRLRSTASGGRIRLKLFRDESPLEDFPPQDNMWMHIAGVLSANTLGVANLFVDNVFEKHRSVALGAWQDVPFSAANFSGNGAMTWTVTSPQVLANRYTVIGNTMIWDVQVAASTIGGTPNTNLLINIPDGFTAMSATHFTAVGYCNDAGTITPALVSVNSGTQIGIVKTNSTNWSAGANYLYFQLTLSVG